MQAGLGSLLFLGGRAVPELTAAYVSRLQDAIQASELRMKEFRNRRLEALQQFVGTHYGGHRRRKKAVPINVIYTGASVYVPNLVARNPAYRVRTETDPLRPFANTFELSHNKFCRKEIGLKKILRQTVFDSIFGMGLVKIAYLSPGRQIDIEGEIVDIGEISVVRIDEDDYILDPWARDREEAQFEGHTMRVPLDWAKEVYDNVDGLAATHAPFGGEQAAEQSQVAGVKAQELEESTEVSEVFLSRRGLIVTLPAKGQGTKPLNVIEWEGPEAGPYAMLGYTYVADNALPLPPVAVWMDLHEMINALARKMKRQSERQKKILAYEDRAAEDAQRIVNADDGETVKVTDAKAFAEIEFGGTSPFQEGFLQWLLMLSSRQQGNVDLLGGLASKSRSATEAAMVGGNAQVRVTDMADMVYTFAKEIGERVAWFLWNDPLVQIDVRKTVAGTNIGVPASFSAETLQGDFDDYDFSIQAYSMKPKNPEEYAKSLMEWWSAVVLPTMEMAAAQGAGPDIPAFVRLMAKEMGIDEVEELYRGGVPQMEQGGMGGHVGAPGQRGMGGGAQQSRGAYYVQQVSEGAQQGAPKPQMAGATPFKRV